MTHNQKINIRTYQEVSNIPPDAREELLEEVKPRDNWQKKMINSLKLLLRKVIRTFLVCGTEGTGKTYIACAAINSALVPLCNNESNRESFYITQSEMAMMFRSEMHGGSEYKLFQKFVEYNLLVIDEVGRSKNSEYQMEIIEALISKRYAWNRPTILISNDTAEEITQLFDRHILDRLNAGGPDATLEMNGESQRGKENG